MSGVERIANAYNAFSNDARKSELETVSLEIPQLGVTIRNWTSYQFSTDWTEANSSWTCTIADGNFQLLQGLIQNGHKAVLKVNDKVVCTGYVDKWHIASSRSGGGSSMTISGRDTLSPACDSCIDPKFDFDDKKTLREVLVELFAPFGFTNFEVDDSVNLQKLTGLKSIQVDASLRTQLSIALKKKWKPHVGEGVYAFIERLGRRLGFHVWCSADGLTLYCGQPDYTTKPVGSIVHKNEWLENQANKNGLGRGTPAPSTETNVLRSECVFDWHKQPSVVIATGAFGNKTSAYQGGRVFMINELLIDASNEPQAVKDLRERYKKNSRFVPPRPYIKRCPQIQQIDSLAFTKLLVVHDDESKDYAHLTNFAKAALSQAQSRFLEVDYTLVGHGQETPEGHMLWTPNTLVNVHDDVNGIYGALWIKARTFEKSRSGGTTTTLKCILPNTFELFSEETPTAKQQAAATVNTRPRVYTFGILTPNRL